MMYFPPQKSDTLFNQLDSQCSETEELTNTGIYNAFGVSNKWGYSLKENRWPTRFISTKNSLQVNVSSNFPRI